MCNDSTLTGPLSVDELIRSVMAAKNTAVTAYDTILWKIRTGYIFILYGALTFLLHVTEGGLSGMESVLVGVIVLGFSAVMLLLDLQFLRSKLRVVTHQDRLTEIALRRASGEFRPRDDKELRRLLLNSGEKRHGIAKGMSHAYLPPCVIYVGSAVVAAAVLWLMRGGG